LKLLLVPHSHTHWVTIQLPAQRVS